MTPDSHLKVKPIRWKDDHLALLDQRCLPHEIRWLSCQDTPAVVEAIQQMVVRGAPAIGIAAAYGVVLAARSAWHQQGTQWKDQIQTDLQALAASRPTAVNLFWALERMQQRLERLPDDQDPEPQLLEKARQLHEADLEANQIMGRLGAQVIAAQQDRGREVMTHCNAGALATAGYGTALGVIRQAWSQGLISQVHVNETRPWLQGARLTAWELAEEDIPVSLNVDAAAAHQLKTQPISWVIVGADRVTAQGDVANKIGTYQLAIQALHHGASLMVVAPTSTLDLDTEYGEDIEIENRSAEEVTHINGQRLAAQVAVANPVFDVTPADLIDVLVTEKGVIHRPNKEKIARLMSLKAVH